jgi:magnesium transporter
LPPSLKTSWWPWARQQSPATSEGLITNPTFEATELPSFQLQELDLFVGQNFLILVHDESLSCLENVQRVLERGAFRQGRGPVRLAHEILDALVDQYLPVMDQELMNVELLERQLHLRKLRSPEQVVFTFRRRLAPLRRIILRQKELFYWLSHRDIEWFSTEETLRFRDIYDHMVQVMSVSETLQESLSAAIDTQLSLTNTRMSEVTQMLTVLSVLILPLNLITGIYGMNFQFMPELQWRFGYPAVVGLMLTVSFATLGYLRWRRWI